MLSYYHVFALQKMEHGAAFDNKFFLRIYIYIYYFLFSISYLRLYFIYFPLKSILIPLKLGGIRGHSIYFNEFLFEISIIYLLFFVKILCCSKNIHFHSTANKTFASFPFKHLSKLFSLHFHYFLFLSILFIYKLLHIVLM